MTLKEDDCVNIIDGGIDGDGKTHLSYVMRRIDNDGNSGLWIPHTYKDRHDGKEHSYYLAAVEGTDRNPKTYPDGTTRTLTVKKVPCPQYDKDSIVKGESKGESKGGRKTRRRKRHRRKIRKRKTRRRKTRRRKRHRRRRTRKYRQRGGG